MAIQLKRGYASVSRLPTIEISICAPTVGFLSKRLMAKPLTPFNECFPKLVLKRI